MEKEIEKEILKAQKEISELKKNSISSIQIISGSIVSNIIENISGDKLNESSIKATVEDISKKNMNKYLMIMDATFWVTISFFIFLGILNLFQNSSKN